MSYANDVEDELALELDDNLGTALGTKFPSCIESSHFFFLA